jgi:hypothetical protein
MVFVVDDVAILQDQVIGEIRRLREGMDRGSGEREHGATGGNGSGYSVKRTIHGSP